MRLSFASLPRLTVLAASLAALWPARHVAAQLQLSPFATGPQILPVPERVVIPPPAARRWVRVLDRLDGGGNILAGVGGAIFLNGRSGGEEAEPHEAKMESDPGGAQWIEFADGTHLHGVVESLDTAHQEMNWRRTDLAQPLVFPLAQVSRLVVGSVLKPGAKNHATIKLRRGGWFGGELLGLQGGQVQFKLPDSPPLQLDRRLVEWIAFSSAAAPECYSGPDALAGWSSTGAWSYKDGGLHLAGTPAPIGRTFEALPDQVEYALEIEQDLAESSFAVLLHGRQLNSRGFMQIMVQGDVLRLWAQTGDNVKVEQADLAPALRPPGLLGGYPRREAGAPLRLQIFENYTEGRIVVAANGTTIGDWAVGKGPPGGNHGGFSFQPMAWNAEAELTLRKIRVLPWDGRLPGQDLPDETLDRVSVAGGEFKTGQIETITSEQVKVRSGNSVVEIPRGKVTLLRLCQVEQPGEIAEPVARVQLAFRGEVEALALALREGKLRVLTAFGPLALPVDALREVQFLGAPWTPPTESDTLVFKSGDRLRGWLESAGEGRAVRWRLARSGESFEVASAHAAGVLFRRGLPRPAGAFGTVARFRNGDWLAGEFVTLDAQNLVLDVPFARQLTFTRPVVKALYFPSDGRTAILDGGSNPEAWLRGAGLGRSGILPTRRNPFARAPQRTAGPWSYFNGVFKIPALAAESADAAGNGPLLGRYFPAMPPSVEFSFEVAASKAPPFVTAQLFSDPENPGYMLQLYGEGMNLYDLNARQRGAAVNPLQVQFGSKVKRASHHRVRLLADRPSGRLTVVIDDVVAGQFPPKAPAVPRNLGCGLQLAAQPGAACAFSNLWIGPWDGQPPGSAPAEPLESVVLGNGDESQGKITLATPLVVKMDADLGSIDLPVERLSMIDFGGNLSSAGSGPRVRLASQGSLALHSFRVGEDAIVCQTAAAGELRLPLEALKELAFGASPGAATEEELKP